jgi:hypothetical protein
MKIKTFIAAIALAMIPGWVLAQGCTHQETIGNSSASCAEGYIWDSEKSTCVVQASS